MAGFYLITGASRGIGAALAQSLVARGNTVLGVSRGRPEGLTSASYHHLTFNLTNTARVAEIMAKVDEVVGSETFDFICLVNNASAVDPIGSIDKCPIGEIESHLQIGLLSPMMLTSLFIKRFAVERARKKVAFVSSGAAFRPLPDESVYCTAKAGLHMFAQCIGEEQKTRQDGFEVISIGPGMVETAMQVAIRSRTTEEFAMVDFFKQAFENGQLTAPNDVAEKICLLLENDYEQGKFVSVTDV